VERGRGEGESAGPGLERLGTGVDDILGLLHETDPERHAALLAQRAPGGPAPGGGAPPRGPPSPPPPRPSGAGGAGPLPVTDFGDWTAAGDARARYQRASAREPDEVAPPPWAPGDGPPPAPPGAYARAMRGVLLEGDGDLARRIRHSVPRDAALLAPGIEDSFPEGLPGAIRAARRLHAGAGAAAGPPRRHTATGGPEGWGGAWPARRGCSEAGGRRGPGAGSPRCFEEAPLPPALERDGPAGSVGGRGPPARVRSGNGGPLDALGTPGPMRRTEGGGKPRPSDAATLAAGPPCRAPGPGVGLSEVMGMASRFRRTLPGDC